MEVRSQSALPPSTCLCPPDILHLFGLVRKYDITQLAVTDVPNCFNQSGECLLEFSVTLSSHRF